MHRVMLQPYKMSVSHTYSFREFSAEEQYSSYALKCRFELENAVCWPVLRVVEVDFKHRKNQALSRRAILQSSVVKT